MICETCHGTGKRLNPALTVFSDHLTGSIVYNPDPGHEPLLIPCDDCGGCGVAHCCDGLQAQPDERCR